MEYWIWLRQLSGIGTVLEKRLLDRCKSPKSIYEANAEELMLVAGIGAALAKVIRQNRSLDQAESILEKALKNDMKLLTYHDPLYPVLAKEYRDAPTLLYYKGQLRKNSTGVVIVGSRRCTAYGKRAAVEASGFLAENNIPVISGMAKGIDGYAHTGCLKAGGYTIAFLGNGVDICYPKEHQALMDAIIENGAVISQYPPNTKPWPEYFPQRNALISSWGEKVLVIEAAEKSGALITAAFAKEQGKEVYALPHEIYNPSGRGANQLIADGVNIYLHPSQLLTDYDAVKKETKLAGKILTGTKGRTEKHSYRDGTALTDTERKILSSISSAPKTIEQIGVDIGIDQLKLIEILSMMELSGLIHTMSGGRFGRT
ncbi:DNA-processing protein DprA [Metallumcola ferriviriculae]|uniref:DNA-processing protein DprA n=1 Tax=Metallumcola ferriviriculae TaxID=3039180 RepID=A0AAU0UQS0_9FIRM|nr:DNA-processing protein DprA [Desulfitibacteraceae bacterium MK1]